MQTRGLVPALSSGEKKRRNSGTYAKDDCGMASFTTSRRPKRLNSNPKSLSGRRAASHKKAYGDQ